MARVSKDKLVKVKPSRRAKSAVNSGKFTSVCDTTGTSLELRERQPLTSSQFDQGGL